MNLTPLKKQFENAKIEFGNEIMENLSSKTDAGNVFPPYIPFIGKHYNEFRILVYSTAQNIGYNNFRDSYQKNFSKLPERLYYFDDFNKKYPKNLMSFEHIDISPYQSGVVAALLGVFIYARFGKIIESLDEINDRIGISNYYKFSLNNNKNDINPETKIQNFINDNKQIEKYWSVNDKLVKEEVETLKPAYIISFNGRKLKELKRFSNKDCELIKINDPSWILRGGSGVFKENKSWWKKAESCKDEGIRRLVDHYLNSLNGKYLSKKESVRIYLLKYYTEWKANNER